MSWMLDLLAVPELSLMKYFCAWLATCVGVLVRTKLRDMFLQSPLPYVFRPKRNNLAKEQGMISFNNQYSHTWSMISFNNLAKENLYH